MVARLWGGFPMDCLITDSCPLVAAPVEGASARLTTCVAWWAA